MNNNFKSSRFDNALNRNNSRSDRSSRNHNKRESWHLTVTVQPNDKLRLNQTFMNETYLYNLIVEMFSSNLSSRPELFLKYNAEYEYLFGYAAEHSMALREIKKLKELPEKLQKSESLIKALDETTLILFDPVKWRSNLYPETRREMAKSILKHFVEQAKTKLQKGNKDNVYRSNFYPLSKVDMFQKRHVQLPKSALEIKYDEKKNHTEIKTPYTAQPLIIEGKDLNEMEMDWNLCIIHQEPGRITSIKDEWVIEFRKSTEPYLVKYFEMQNVKHSAFQVAKGK